MLRNYMLVHQIITNEDCGKTGLGHIFFHLLDYVTLNRILKCGDQEKNENKNWTSGQSIQNNHNF